MKKGRALGERSHDSVKGLFNDSWRKGSSRDRDDDPVTQRSMDQLEAPPPGSLPGQVLPRSSGEIGWPFRTPKYAEGPSRRPRGTPDTFSLEWRPIELLRS